MEAGGSFVAVNLKTLAFGVLTNVIADIARPEPQPSRGTLVVQCAQQNKLVDPPSGVYSAFNLWHGQILPDGTAAVTHTWNRPEPMVGWKTQSTPVSGPTAIARSNEPYCDLWPKSRWTMKEVEDIVENFVPVDGGAGALRDALCNRMCASVDFPESGMPPPYSSYERWKELVMQRGPSESTATH
mmetsp:Transcript_76803/g.205187  ORF Transcript_76803/g.205187 Transcript_76803/m.205187 type:complete len:185 (-) Transcript_76803:295-849(-)